MEGEGEERAARVGESEGERVSEKEGGRKIWGGGEVAGRFPSIQWVSELP